MIPQDLHQLNYAARILEDLGLPRKGNLELVADCIESIAKQRRFALFEAFEWLSEKSLAAQSLGQKIDRWWFQNGDYHKVAGRAPTFKGTYVPIDKEATAKEQSTPEFEEASQKTRQFLARWAAGVITPKRLDPAEEKKRYTAWLEKRKP
jgi:hypothetical protein